MIIHPNAHRLFAVHLSLLLLQPAIIGSLLLWKRNLLQKLSSTVVILWLNSHLMLVVLISKCTLFVVVVFIFSTLYY